MRRKLLFIFFFISFLANAQDVDRVFVNGIITAPVGDDVEGVNVYNISTQKGTITDKDGKFKLLVGENDRVQVTALQFNSFTIIIDKGIVDAMAMSVYLNPSVNVLEEVIVRPYDLSGNIEVDVARIKTVDLDQDLKLSYEDVEFNYGFTDDAQSAIRGNLAESVYYNNQNFVGGNVFGLVGLLANSIFSSKNKKKKYQNANNRFTQRAVSNSLRQRFSNAYISETFNIPQGRESEFLFFVQDAGVTPDMLKAENEVMLLQLMFERAEVFKKQ